MRKVMIFLIGLVSLKGVYAYIDPGTGATVIGGLWPLVVAFLSAVLAFVVKNFWQPIKDFFSGLFK